MEDAESATGRTGCLELLGKIGLDESSGTAMGQQSGKGLEELGVAGEGGVFQCRVKCTIKRLSQAPCVTQSCRGCLYTGVIVDVVGRHCKCRHGC